jgi:hypothetical protein
MASCSNKGGVLEFGATKSDNRVRNSVIMLEGQVIFEPATLISGQASERTLTNDRVAVSGPSRLTHEQ